MVDANFQNRRADKMWAPLNVDKHARVTYGNRRLKAIEQMPHQNYLYQNLFV